MTPEMVAVIGRAITQHLTMCEVTLQVRHDPDFGWYVWPDGDVRPYYQPRSAAKVEALSKKYAA